MRKILLVSGCSYTNKDFVSDYHPDMDTSWPNWSELLAKKLDMDLINVAYSGAGNEYIYSSLLDKIMTTDNIGLVMAAWTQSTRRDWERKGKWFNNANSLFKTEQNPFSNDVNACIDKTLRYYYSLQEICKYKKIPYKAFQMLHIIRGWSWDRKFPGDLSKTEIESRPEHLQKIVNSIYCEKIDDSFLGWPGDTGIGGFCIKADILGYGNEEYEISERDNHPSKLGQEKITEFIYDRLG
tara:strand:+ start:478 stop:1194 length:717 start_codon:yes stop_codon:yes gene_type:complete